MELHNVNAGFELVGVIMTAFGFMRLLDGVDSRAVSIATILITVIGLILMLVL